MCVFRCEHVGACAVDLTRHPSSPLTLQVTLMLCVPVSHAAVHLGSWLFRLQLTGLFITHFLPSAFCPEVFFLPYELAGVYWSKGWWRWSWQLDYWSYKSCKDPVRSSPPTNQHPVFLQARCPSCHPTNTVKALKGDMSVILSYSIIFALFAKERNNTAILYWTAKFRQSQHDRKLWPSDLEHFSTYCDYL